MDISANIVNLFTTNPEIDISLDLPPVPEIKIKKQADLVRRKISLV